MRVVIFSDTHGNSIALDAVLADVERLGGVDAHWFVGDAAALGFDPVGTIQRLRDLPNLTAVRGNTDRETAHDPDGLEDAFLAQAAREPPVHGRQAGDVDVAGGGRGRLPAGAPVCRLRCRRGPGSAGRDESTGGVRSPGSVGVGPEGDAGGVRRSITQPNRTSVNAGQHGSVEAAAP